MTVYPGRKRPQTGGGGATSPSLLRLGQFTFDSGDIPANSIINPENANRTVNEGGFTVLPTGIQVPETGYYQVSFTVLPNSGGTG